MNTWKLLLGSILVMYTQTIGQNTFSIIHLTNDSVLQISIKKVFPQAIVDSKDQGIPFIAVYSITTSDFNVVQQVQQYITDVKIFYRDSSYFIEFPSRKLSKKVLAKGPTIDSVEDKFLKSSLISKDVIIGNNSGQTQFCFEFGAGYGWPVLDDVNSYLDWARSDLAKLYIYSGEPNYATGGGYYRAELNLITFNGISIGASVSGMNVTGDISATKNALTYQANFSCDNTELLAHFGFVGGDANSFGRAFFRTGLGLGMASVDQKAKLAISDPDPYYASYSQSTYKLSGKYFAYSLQGGILIGTRRARFSFSIMYRFADAGILRGEQLNESSDEPPARFSGVTMKGYRDTDIGFDFSNFGILCSLSLNFLP